MPDTSNILLTGLPRSGTTMACWLLNKTTNVVALHEPLKLREYPETTTITSILTEFITETRIQLQREGTAPSHAMRQGRIDSNPISTPKAPNERREVMHSHQVVFFGKQTSPNFQLVIKHNAPFTASINSLRDIYPMSAIIRNPLALLLSWQTVPLPIRAGRLPMAEYYDKELKEKLSSIATPLERQIYILEWCFSHYQSIQQANIFRYEDIVATGGKQLSSLFPGAEQLDIKLTSRNHSEFYPTKSSQMLAELLMKSSHSWRAYYSDDEILYLNKRDAHN